LLLKQRQRFPGQRAVGLFRFLVLRSDERLLSEPDGDAFRASHDNHSIGSPEIEGVPDQPHDGRLIHGILFIDFEPF
jgi:hypothetical protein